MGEAQVVVISSAVSAQNPEVVAAKAKQIPVIPRAEMLAELMRLKFGVAIAGAHGKTTTTSMVANVLAQGGLDPTMVIGGKVNALGSHARLGRGDLLVAEADESDGSFLRLSPTIVAVTNLDREHLDHYGSMERINECFLEFINKVPFYGLAVLCADDDRLRALFPSIVKRYQTYGLPEREGVMPDFSATDISLNQWGAEFRAHFRGRNLGPFRLAVPGRSQCLERAGGDRDRRRIGCAGGPHQEGAGRLIPGSSGAFICEGKPMGSWSWTTTGIIRPKSKPPWPRRSKAGETGGWSCCFSRIAIPGRETCWRILRRRLTNRTSCS